MSNTDLLRVAGEQHGYFSTAQAEEHGLSRRALLHRAHIGEFEHLHYGLWRLAHWPLDPKDDLYALAVRAPSGTFSHETALSLLGLGDIIPSEIHITVPETSGLKPRPGLRIHRSRTGAARERTLRDGLWISTATRALLDTAAARHDPSQLRAAAREAVSRGLLTRDDQGRLSRLPAFAGEWWRE